MKLFVETVHEGICVEISSISVHSSLTFCTIPNSLTRQNILLECVKKGIANSFETRGNEIKIAFFTKFVQRIE